MNLLKAKITNRPLLLILVLAFLLRFWGVWFGLPQKHVVDEQGTVYVTLYAASHQLRLPTQVHDALLTYLLLPIYLVIFLIGVGIGAFKNSQDFLVWYIQDPTVIFLVSRMVSVLAGTISVYFIYKIGKIIFEKETALIAAFFYSITFLAVKEAHYIKQDTLATLLLLLVVYTLIQFLKANQISRLSLCGIFFGAMVSSKIAMAIFIPLILFLLFLKVKNNLRVFLFFFVSVLVGYVLTNPYFFVDPVDSFYQTLDHLTRSTKFYPEVSMGKPVWYWFIFIQIPKSIGWIYYITGILGMGTLFLGKNKHAKIFIYLILWFVLTIGFITNYHFARYALIALPYFSLCTAFFCRYIFKNYFPPYRFVFGLIIIFVALTSFLRSMKFDLLITMPDTRKIASKWVLENIAFNSVVGVEDMLQVEYPANANVTIPVNLVTIEHRLVQAQKNNTPGIYLEALKKTIDGTGGYTIIPYPRIDFGYDEITTKQLSAAMPADFVKREIEYLILSSWVERPSLSAEFVNELETYYELITRFHPSPKFASEPHFLDIDTDTLDAVSILDQNLVFGPEISIYKLKSL